MVGQLDSSGALSRAASQLVENPPRPTISSSLRAGQQLVNNVVWQLASKVVRYALGDQAGAPARERVAGAVRVSDPRRRRKILLVEGMNVSFVQVEIVPGTSRRRPGARFWLTASWRCRRVLATTMTDRVPKQKRWGDARTVRERSWFVDAATRLGLGSMAVCSCIGKRGPRSRTLLLLAAGPVVANGDPLPRRRREPAPSGSSRSRLFALPLAPRQAQIGEHFGTARRCGTRRRRAIRSDAPDRLAAIQRLAGVICRVFVGEFSGTCPGG